MAEIIGLVSTLVGIILSVGSGLLWWSSQKSDAEVKKYAAQREFGHIKTGLEQLSVSLVNEFQDIERRLDSINDRLVDLRLDIRDAKVKCDTEKQ